MSPPQAGQVQAPSCSGWCTISWRGRWSGNGLRFGRDGDDLFGFAGFQLLEPQFELLDLPGQPLRGAAELHPPQLGDLEFELLDFQGAQLDGELGRLQLRRRRRQFALHGQGKGPQRCGIGGQIG